MADKNKTIHVTSDKVRYDMAHSEYAFRMRYRRFPWWLLLLLLLPLLFIPIRKDVTIHVEYGDGTPVDSATVNLTFEKYHLWEQQGLQTLTEFTSSGGIAVFPQLVDYPFWILFQPKAGRGRWP